MMNEQWQHTSVKVYFNEGIVNGRAVQKMKTYRHVAQTVTDEALYEAVEVLAQCSNKPFIGAEKVVTTALRK